MYVLVFNAWNGMRCEIHYGEIEAKKRYRELEELYSEIHLLKAEDEIPM